MSIHEWCCLFVAGEAKNLKMKKRTRERRRPQRKWLWYAQTIHAAGLMYCLLEIMAWSGALAIPVFDCTGAGIETFPISLMEPEECEPAAQYYKDPDNVVVQVIQKKTKRLIETFKCKVTESTSVTRCGFDSLTYGAFDTKREAPVLISAEDCVRLVKHATLRYGGREWHGIPLHQKVLKQYYSKGSVNSDGSCQTEDFVSNGQLYQNSYEKTELAITAAKFHGQLDVESGQIVFDTIRTEFVHGQLYDPTVGLLVWNATEPRCHEESSTLYHGAAEFYRQKNASTGVLVLHNEKTEQYGGFLMGDYVELCGSTIHTTQIPGVLVKVLARGALPIYNSDYKGTTEQLHTSILAQMHYLHLTQEKSIEARFMSIYRGLCNVDYNGRATQLRLVARDNDLAVLDLYGPGHISVRAGGAAYIVKCAAVTAEVRTHVNCTLDLPVTYQNESLFVDPVSLILKTQSRVVPCKALMPTRIKLVDTWYCLLPEMTECPPPRQITSTIEQLPHARDPAADINANLFTAEQIAARKHFLTYVLSRMPALDQLAQRSLANEAAGFSTGIPLTDQDKESLVYYLSASLSPGFYFLGYAYFYVFTTFTCLGAIKMILDTSIQLYIVLRIRGCGWWIFPAFIHSFFLLIALPFRYLLPDPDLVAQIPELRDQMDRLRRDRRDDDDDNGDDGPRRGDGRGRQHSSSRGNQPPHLPSRSSSHSSSNSRKPQQPPRGSADQHGYVAVFADDALDKPPPRYPGLAEQGPGLQPRENYGECGFNEDLELPDLIDADLPPPPLGPSTGASSRFATRSKGPRVYSLLAGINDLPVCERRQLLAMASIDPRNVKTPGLPLSSHPATRQDAPTGAPSRPCGLTSSNQPSTMSPANHHAQAFSAEEIESTKAMLTLSGSVQDFYAGL